MGQEIERKFLVNSETYKEEAFHSYTITQGFLSKDPERTVRIRLKESQAFITVKGISTPDGLSRFEWEKEISLDDAEALLKLCSSDLIEKRRYLVKYDQHIFEVDEFTGRLRGLVIAEIELKTENETFKTPSWIGKEVTGNPNFYNSNL